MSRRVCLVIVPSCLLLVMMGCTRVREFPRTQFPGTQTVAAAPSPQATGGRVLVAVPTEQTLFGPPLAHASVQPGTLKLKKLIAQHARLKVTALPSSLRTVALAMQERAGENQRWGGVMIPQERRVFLLFARDSSLGDWLIMITDVEVKHGPDPIPLVAYRWARSEVEAYAQCGIPQSLIIDHCTDTFYLAPDMIYVSYKSSKAGQ